MAKDVDESRIDIEMDEHGGQLIVYAIDQSGDVIDLAFHNQPARPKHRLMALRAARRSLVKAIARIDKMIAKHTRG